jgi:pimeloyl-ACP methyl ester carboxylesterase
VRIGDTEVTTSLIPMDGVYLVPLKTDVAIRLLTEKMSRRGMPIDIPRTWILTLRDRAHPPQAQRKYIEALGGVQTLIEINTCHMLMDSEPEQLAQILIERCRLYR